MNNRLLVALFCLALACQAVAARASGTIYYGHQMVGANGYQPLSPFVDIQDYAYPGSYDAARASVGVITDSAATQGQALLMIKKDPTMVAIQGVGNCPQRIQWYAPLGVAGSGPYGGDGSLTATGGQVTAQIRFRITPDQAFQLPAANVNITHYPTGIINVLMVTFSNGKAFRLCVFAGANGVHYMCVMNSIETLWPGNVPGYPRGAGGSNTIVTESNGFLYNGILGYNDLGGQIGTTPIPVDMSVYHTYTLVGKWGGQAFNLLVDGVSVYDSAGGAPIDQMMPSTSSTENCVLNMTGGVKNDGIALSMTNENQGGTVNGAPLPNNSGTGSIAVDYIGYEPGVSDPYWIPFSSTVSTWSGLRSLGKGSTAVNFTGDATVTYAPTNEGVRTTNFFYIGEQEGLPGLRVVNRFGNDSLSLGNMVTGLVGYMVKNSTGEPYFQLTQPPVLSTGPSVTINPLGVKNIEAATDAKLSGQAITVCGVVKSVAPDKSSFTINDGSRTDDLTIKVNGIHLPNDIAFDIAVLNHDVVGVVGVVSPDASNTPVVNAQTITTYNPWLPDW